MFNWLDDDKQSGTAQDTDGIDSWHGPPEVCVGQPRGRGLHSSTVQLNLSRS